MPVALSDQLKIPKYPIGAIFGTIRTISITKNPPQKKRPVVLIAKRLDLTVKPGQPKFTLRTCLPPAPSAPPPAVPWAVLDYRCSRVHRILTVLAIRCCARFASLDLGFVHGGGGGGGVQARSRLLVVRLSRQGPRPYRPGRRPVRHGIDIILEYLSRLSKRVLTPVSHDLSPAICHPCQPTRAVSYFGGCSTKCRAHWLLNACDPIRCYAQFHISPKTPPPLQGQLPPGPDPCQLEGPWPQVRTQRRRQRRSRLRLAVRGACTATSTIPFGPFLQDFFNNFLGTMPPFFSASFFFLGGGGDEIYRATQRL